MIRKAKVRNPNGTTRTFYGEEAETLSAKEAGRFDARLAAMSDADMLACMVPAPAFKPEAITIR